MFVECTDLETGAFAALLAIETVNAALDGRSLRPLFPDAVRALRELRSRPNGLWSASHVTRRTAIPIARAETALEMLARLELIEEQSYSVNLSGERLYRMTRESERAN